MAGLILLMNYNHPYTFTAQKAVISIPVTPQVTGIVSEVTDKNNQLIKKGEVLFKLDPMRYQARVDRLQADLVTATHNIDNLKAQLLKRSRSPPAFPLNEIACIKIINAI